MRLVSFCSINLNSMTRTLRTGNIVPGLAEVTPEYGKVGGVDYQVVIEVRRLHSTLSKLIPDDGEVGGVDYVVGVDIATFLRAELLGSSPSRDSQGSAIGRERSAEVSTAPYH